MTTSASQSATGAHTGWTELRWHQEQILSHIFLLREIRKALLFLCDLHTTCIVFGIEGLNASNELRQALLHARFGDVLITVGELEKFFVVTDGG